MSTSSCIFLSMNHVPGVAHFAKITIILSRRGTLELCVHWFKIDIAKVGSMYGGNIAKSPAEILPTLPILMFSRNIKNLVIEKSLLKYGPNLRIRPTVGL